MFFWILVYNFVWNVHLLCNFLIFWSFCREYEVEYLRCGHFWICNIKVCRNFQKKLPRMFLTHISLHSYPNARSNITFFPFILPTKAATETNKTSLPSTQLTNHTLCRKKNSQKYEKWILMCFRRIISCVKLIVSGFIFSKWNSVHRLKKDWRLLNIPFLTLPTHYLSSPLLLTFKFRFWEKFIKILNYSMEQCIHVNWKSCWTRQIVGKISIWNSM